MVKIKYDGHMKECRIKVHSSIMKWKKGEVKDISDSLVAKLLKNNDFKVVGNTPIKKPKKVIEESREEDTLNFDLNNDGVVDKKDTSIAGKVLANARKMNKQKNEEDD